MVSDAFQIGFYYQLIPLPKRHDVLPLRPFDPWVLQQLRDARNTVRIAKNLIDNSTSGRK